LAHRVSPSVIVFWAAGFKPMFSKVSVVVLVPLSSSRISLGPQGFVAESRRR
jgi:hypothetical protein